MCFIDLKGVIKYAVGIDEQIYFDDRIGAWLLKTEKIRIAEVMFYCERDPIITSNQIPSSHSPHTDLQSHLKARKSDKVLGMTISFLASSVAIAENTCNKNYPRNKNCPLEPRVLKTLKSSFKSYWKLHRHKIEGFKKNVEETQKIFFKLK